MSMTPRLWSISALAIELRKDRRTIAAVCRDVRPAGQKNGKPAWRLNDVLDAIRRKEAPARPTGTRPPPPPGMPAWMVTLADGISGNGDPRKDSAAVWLATGLFWTFYQADHFAAEAVVAAGGKMDLAHKAARMFACLYLDAFHDFLAHSGMEPWRSTPDAPLIDTNAFRAPEWEALREATGEPAWEPPADDHLWRGDKAGMERAFEKLKAADLDEVAP